VLQRIRARRGTWEAEQGDGDRREESQRKGRGRQWLPVTGGDVAGPRERPIQHSAEHPMRCQRTPTRRGLRLLSSLS
jgi:hypothetical protein